MWETIVSKGNESIYAHHQWENKTKHTLEQNKIILT